MSSDTLADRLERAAAWTGPNDNRADLMLEAAGRLRGEAGITIADPAPVASDAVAVDDAMVERAEKARVDCLYAVGAYGSAGVSERNAMAMRAAIEAALAQDRASQVSEIKGVV